MSKLRSVNTHFWSDTYVVDLDPIEKLLFLYLLTNEQTNMLGIYELHIRRIAFDTGVDKDMVKKIFDRFEEAGKAKYFEGYVILQKFLKHQSFNSNMETSAIKTWNELPLDVRKDTFCQPILKGLKAFDKGSEPIAEIEVERELEVEEEREEEEVTTSVDDEPTETELQANMIAQYLLDSICIWDDTHKYNRNPPSLSGWITDIDRAIRLDGRTPQQLKYIIDVLFRDNNKIGSFWAPNVQSGKKLRDQFDTIKNQIKAEKENGKPKKQSTEDFARSLDELDRLEELNEI